MTILDNPLSPDAVAHLTSADAMFAACLALGGTVPAARREPGFGTLLRIILEQQVSLASADAVWRRLNGQLAPLTAAGFLTLDDDSLRVLGFSRQKAVYGRGLAEAIASGALDLDGLERADDETAVAALVRLKGIGRWSAEIYLLMALGRPDVFPADDLGVQLGVQSLKGLARRPTR
ncbi:MAG TPA: DNA-3-methyladenine glycosylase 2 family protein, partial [Azospirillaceae bacterium]|nr:DNA-3-methyladenine glycosylase 2 family protein [Azospirillaceae bacterium]